MALYLKQTIWLLNNHGCCSKYQNNQHEFQIFFFLKRGNQLRAILPFHDGGERSTGVDAGEVIPRSPLLGRIIRAEARELLGEQMTRGRGTNA